MPPNPLVMGTALQNWEAYVQSHDDDPLLKAAIAHAQFEIIHPFKDGNGRIGRMLIPLILFTGGALSRPMFYLSAYLEARRDEYYDELRKITEDRRWTAWLKFFLEAVRHQSEENLERAGRIFALYREMHRAFSEITHSQYAAGAVEAFFERPVMRATDFAKAVGFNTRVTANSMLRQLEQAGLIRKLRAGAGRRPAVYALTRLIDIADGRS